MMALYEYIVSRMQSEEGAALAEYGLLVALIAAFCIIAITALGGSIATVFTNIAAAI